MSDDLRRRLEEAGRRPVPPPDPAATDVLEARLLAIARSGPPPTPSPSPGPGRARGPWLALVGTALAALAIAIALGLGTAQPPAAPELAQPVNVVVALADGTTLEDPDGLRLPEGAVVTVGAGGSARIGDLVLGPGDVATVAGGLVSVEHRPPVGSVPDPSAGASTSRPAPTGDAPSPRDPTPDPTRRPTPRPTATRVPEPTRRPDATPRPTEQPTREPTPAPTARPTDAAPTPTPEILPPQLRARAIGTTAFAVTWTRTYRARTYVLLVTGARGGADAPEPEYPGSRVLGEYARPPETPLRFRIPEGVTQLRLLVVALRRDGSELARSRVVTVAIGP